MAYKKELQIGGKTLSLETGAVAKQANGACVIRYGDTVVLATACYKDGNVIGDFYIRKLGKEGAKYGLKYWNKTIKTYKDVSQFWTYDEKKFLEQPVYSRDYPPLKG